MKPHSPTLEGFRAVFREPALPLGEIAWRWSFGAATSLLLGLSLLEYLDTLPVSVGDLLLLRSRQPLLVSQAITHIFHGSAFRFVMATIVLFFTLALGWTVAASLGRAATLKALLDWFTPRRDDVPDASRLRFPQTGKQHSSMRSLMALNLLRVALILATSLGVVAAAILAGFLFSDADPQPGLVFLLFVPLFVLVWLMWSMLNWFLSLASVFVMRDNQDTFGAIAAAVVLCREHLGPVVAVGFWFSLAHILAFIAATTVVAFPMAFAGILPIGVVLGGVLLVTLLYFAVADFLYVGRLAGYVCIVEQRDSPPEREVTAQPTGPEGTQSFHAPALRPQSDDDIMSDIPLSPPTAEALS